MYLITFNNPKVTQIPYSDQQGLLRLQVPIARSSSNCLFLF